MRAPGPLVAAGRDAEIFEYAPGLVLRKARDGRSIAHEAETMRYVYDHGYPVPRIDEVSDDGTAIVMERVEGPVMVDALKARPFKIGSMGKILGDLHARLHEIPAAAFMEPAPILAGDRCCHLDLHPLNVIFSPKGPVVIDWANTRAGDPIVDVGLAYILIAGGEIPGNAIVGRIMGIGRRALVKGFLEGTDEGRLGEIIFDVVAWKCLDPHMSDAEQERMWRAAERLTGHPRP